MNGDSHEGKKETELPPVTDARIMNVQKALGTVAVAQRVHRHGSSAGEGGLPQSQHPCPAESKLSAQGLSSGHFVPRSLQHCLKVELVLTG